MRKGWFLHIAATVWIIFPGIGQAQQAKAPKISPEIWQKVQEKGVVRIAVVLNMPWRAEKLSPADEMRQRDAIATSQKALLAELAGTKYKVRTQYKSTPVISLEVDSTALSILEHSPLVKSVENDEIRFKPFLPQSVPLIGGNDAFAAGYDGTGQTIVIVGTGIDGEHPFLDGKIVAEACYSEIADCPNGQTEQVGPGAATTCIQFEDCDHETHVAGVAAGLEVVDPRTGNPFSGWPRVPRLLQFESDCRPMM